MPGGTKAINYGTVDGSPLPSYVDEETNPPVVFVEADRYLSLLRDPATGEPYLRHVDYKLAFPNRFTEGLLVAKNALLNGDDPKEVVKSLIALQSRPGLLCKATFTCDEYFYLLGLANELAGNLRAAIDSYLYLWLNYSKSPFTVLARLKLVGTLIPPTPTYTLTLTPTITGTVTQTGTATIPGAATPTPTTTLPGIYPFPPTITGVPPYPIYTPPYP
jgi:hypothetical protein